jgi:TonB-dependent starch-binding outer membrane protein SusC
MKIFGKKVIPVIDTGLKKLLLTMKLSFVFALMCILQVNATVHSQNINLEMNGVALRDALKEIESKSDYRFFYSDDLLFLDTKITFVASNLKVEDVLNQLFSESKLTYKIFDNKLIIIAPKEQGEIKVSGTVTDANTGEPLPGVNIVVEGTTQGVNTDVDGKYSLTVNSPDAMLVFSFLGYDKERIQVNGKNVIDVQLKPDVQALDEVVVIGYGVQKKKLVTGATSQVKGSDLEKLNTTNALQALQGQTTGVNITTSSGQPGEGMKVTVRGLGTIGNAGPLYIVDGVQTGDIKYLNNSDIESIDVLKDAASAAIYGSRAANGVILITTKQGKAGKSQISLDAYYGYQNRAKRIETLNAHDYAMIMNEQHINSGGNPSSLPFNISNLPAYNAAGVADNNWLDKMFVKNAVTQNYSLGISGGNEQSVYSMSLSYTGQEGIVGGRNKSNYDRYGARFNSEHNLYKGKVKVGQHLTFSYTEKNGIQVGNQYGNTLRGAFNASPLIPMYDDNGNFFNTADTTLKDQFGKVYWNSTEANPYAAMMINNQNKHNDQKLIADIYAEVEIIKNLKFRTTFGIDYYAGEDRSFTPIYRISTFSFSDYTKVTQGMSKSRSLNSDNVLSYGINKGDHSINVMVGMGARKYTGSWMNGENTDLVFNDLAHAWLTNATNENTVLKKTSGAPNDDDNLLSYFGRIQYSFKETYLINATIRADGSSKFAEGNRWGYFPSVSAGWVMSNESFLRSNNVINFLKLRASWGQNGNQSIDAFQYLAPIGFTQATYNFGDAEGENTPGSYPKRLSYKKLKWETSEQLNFGFDSRFLNNKLSATFDWYKKTTKDWLIKAPLLGTAGADAPFINGGKVVNSGIELGLSYNNNAGKFNYMVNVNGAYNKNDVKEIPTQNQLIDGAANTLYANSTQFYRAQAGHPIGYFWGYKTNGLFQNSADVQNNRSSSGKIIQSSAKPGDVRYVDQNDDGIISEADKVEIGDPNPDFTFGLTFLCDYKALDFSVTTNGVVGNQLVQSYRDHSGTYSNYTTDILGRWTAEGTSNKIPRVTNANINYQFSDLFIQNGDYLRISNVTLGFDVAKVTKLKNFSQCRLYVSVQNLYTLTKYTGMDPEVGYGFDNGPTDKFSSGIDLGFYPRPRTILFGLNLKF